MSKNILTIGFELASDTAHEETFTSKTSLLDWDIILFKPDIYDFTLSSGSYGGKPSLNDTLSFRLKEACEHWRREIKQAVESGKTVLVFLPPLEEVFIDTGEREYSGTGRNQKTTRLVKPYTNYAAIPVKLDPVLSTGSAMKLAPPSGDILAPLWAEFGSLFKYKVQLASDTKGICVTTRVGDRPVGAIIRSAGSSGSLVLLPDIDFYPESFFCEKEEDEDDEKEKNEEEDNENWSPEATIFAGRFLGAVVALDKALHATVDVTPEPGWATEPEYALATEKDLLTDLLNVEREVEETQKRKEYILEPLKNATRLRALLYEKGKRLENAIIEALHLLGFQAERYKEGDSEFDVVFECPEGRLLGEAEGKDTKAINVDKLRQLAMNIHEDLQRDDVDAPAKGVLFGNGYRLSSPTERDIQFTEKCITAARSSSTALLTTTDLYAAAQYLSKQPDEEYAKRCRKSILSGSGIVVLPTRPSVAETEPADIKQA